MRRKLRAAGLAASLTAASLMVFPPTLVAGDLWFRKRPKRPVTSVERLAQQIDKLERHIDEYGSVVAKKPDVWGEARLTRHRREFEKETAKKITAFNATLNASLSRSDQAFLANAFTLGLALSGPEAVSHQPQVNTGDEDGTTTTTKVEIPKGKDAATALTNIETVIKRSDANKAAFIGFKGTDKEGIALEPTIGLDQLKRYLDHLHEIRRINEGDDIGDSPGYTINLVRIPVSVLPGDQTREGHGAEITVTVTPLLNDETLPRTFRRWVINDLVDELTLPILNATDATTLEAISKLNDDESGKLSEEDWKKYEAKIQSIFSMNPSPRARRARYSVPASQLGIVYGTGYAIFEDDHSPAGLKRVPRFQPLSYSMKSFINGSLSDKDVSVVVPSAREWLKEELAAAYDFLERPENATLWNLTHKLPRAVRGTRDEILTSLQKQFGFHIAQGVKYEQSWRDKPHAFRVTEELAWCILVQSALLNEQLIDDMKRVAAEKNCSCLCTAPMQFHLPSQCLQPSAREAFNKYVQCRWPIKAFAVDPVTQDQNIADKFALRRELQLAASLAFSSGQMSAQDFSQFARRVELDTETVALNRTVVGFSHGDDTFGWRFYPRFQSPELVGNFEAMKQTLFGGPSRDSILRDHRLEPGQRECVAILITPGFIPYVTIDTRTNWFELSDPDDRKFNLQDSVTLGREIVALKRAENACVKDESLHRGGTVHRLMRSVDQLESRLPLQTSFLALPIRDNEGGFQALAGGTTSLGPELHGFYGGRGIQQADTGTTTLFLVGNNFSVHDTKVLAGGLELKDENVYMLSRELLKVAIPNNGGIGAESKKMNIQVATPYGVAELDIPVLDAKKTKEQASAEAATSAAVAKAVAGHEETHHPVAYSWKSTPKVSGTIFLDATGVSGFRFDRKFASAKVEPVVSSGIHEDVFEFLDPTVVATGKDGRVTSSTANRLADLAFVLVVNSKNDKKKATDPKNIGFWRVELGKEFELAAIRDEIAAVLPDVMSKDFDAKDIVLQGYLRFLAGNGHPERPIYRIKDPLTITVSETRKCEDCKAVPESAPAPPPKSASISEGLPIR